MEGGDLSCEASLFSGNVTEPPEHRKGLPHVLLFCPHPPPILKKDSSQDNCLLAVPQLSVWLTLSLTAPGLFLPSLASSSSVTLTHPLSSVSMLSLTIDTLRPLTNSSVNHGA